MSEPAKLPESLRETKPRTLSELKAGDSAVVTFTALQVNTDGRCFLRPDEELVNGPRRNLALWVITVQRRADGYHVIAPEGHHWRYGDFKFPTDKLIPVASITVEESRHK